ncbi:TIGR03013 family XrtA/PEP-CTERM system glycosyltransferase [Inmirania thermothiophila]|uniref:Sugar transferase (PEP-CTERM system associated)/exopolysaccharide biosynthesis polyprenyl glycosylphosphotransferase n=1 Tax=Inmirania thermothiophila TaxID=1750597 RepID=A0A3N1YAQ5_9GAMM|nr:TIGR03013 family XrtA/PEP-CTERM system glycosyltransferase [Inmirania thermothiophila]ROR34712.1 sugar transferase (PEP-CTERM system associated)/exopolysaccharide biosynthesis polyprenyl glycosylphosphotransferase [Inmirania thermothiophila]
MIRLFRHYIPGWFVALAAVEGLVFGLAMYVGEALRMLGIGELESPLRFGAFANASAFAVLMVLNFVVVGLYQRRMAEGASGQLVRMMIAFAFGFAELAVINLVFPGVVPWRRSLALAFPAAFAGVLLTRWAFVRLCGIDVFKRRVLVVGGGEPARRIIEGARAPGAGFKVVGCVPLGEERLAVEPRYVVEHNVIRFVDDLASERTGVGDLLGIVRDRDVDEVVVAVSDRRGHLPMRELLACRMVGVPVSDFHSFYERETGRVMLEDLHPSWLVFSDGFRGGLAADAVKRLFDLAAAGLLLALTWPVMLLAALAVKLEDGGPVFYRQTRVGQHGRPFEVIKFRSMRPDAEADGRPRWARPGDARVTRVGAWLRKTRIDELPQLINVLRGEMSLVGPRPERPEFVARLQERIPYYGERHRVKPGLTGWAQVSYPYGASDEDAAEKLRYDLYYMKNHSLFLDLVILVQTVEVVLWGRGAR